MKNLIVLLTLTTCLLSACAVGPNFTRPNFSESQSYTSKSLPRHLGSQHFKVGKEISATWWHDFASQDLNEMMNLGIKNNYTLAAMQQKLAQAQEWVNAATGSLWPQLSLNATAGRQKYGAATFGPTSLKASPFTYYELGPNLNYLLDVVGHTRRSIEKQQALAEYQAQELNATYLTLTGNIAITSLTIAILNEQLSTTEKMIAEDKKNLALVQKAFQLGSATKADLFSAETQLTNDEALLPSMRQQLQLAKNALNVLVGASPSDWQPPSFKLNQFKLPNELPLSLPSALARARPDILAAEALLHAACAEVGIATANLYPAFTLSATTLQESLTPAGLFKSSANAWGYFANMTTPILSGGSLRADLRATQHGYQAAYLAYQQVVLEALVQVSDVLNAIMIDEQNERLQRKAMLTAKSSLTLARVSYAAGSVSLLEVLDAKRLYSQANLAYVKAKGQRYLDTVQLYLVLGGRLR